MATPIKETPVLSGKDSERFYEEIRANKSKKVPKKDYDRAMDVYKQMTEDADL